MREILKHLSVPSLFTAKRLDLVWRVQHATQFETAWCQFSGEEYEFFMGALAGGGKFTERGEEYTPSSRLESFNQLLRSISSNGLIDELQQGDFIKVTSHGHILNGAHRVAASHAMGIDELKGQVYPLGKEAWSTDAASLRNVGLPEAEVEWLLLESLKIRKTSRFVFLFAEGRQHKEKLLAATKHLGDILYQRDIELTSNGVRRLIEVAYSMNDWWTPSYIDGIVREKTRGATAPHHAVLVIYEPKDTSLDNVRDLKLQIRSELERVGVHGKSLHGSDNWQDTEPVLQLLLKAPGRFFLNASPYGSERGLLSRLDEEHCSLGGAQAETITIAGSSVLELHGLRRARDIDFFTVSDIPAKSQWDWGCRNADYSPRDVWAACHPRNTFVYMGWKFQGLSHYSGLQRYRKLTNKGRHDLGLAEGLLESLGENGATRLVSMALAWKQTKYAGKVHMMRLYGRVAGAVPAWIRPPIKALLRKLRP